ncbi:MAG TPA: hypothetical protein VGD67_16590, partial [Pseudonocardiaceae bacterium]
VRRLFQARAGAGRLRRLARLLPWELVALAAAVLSFQRLRRGAVSVDPSSLLPVVDSLALLFPLLCLAVVVGVAVRLSGWALRAAHRVRGWRWPAAVWALRRLAAGSRLTLALLAVAGLAVGVIAVGVGVSGTEKAAVLDKGRMFVGTDTTVRLRNTLGDRETVPDALRGRGTLVRVTEVAYEERRGRVLVVDPDTFADGVTWNPDWTGADLGALLGLLGPAEPDGSVPAIQVGDASPRVYAASSDVPPLDVVATTPTFLGRGHADAMMIISRDALAGRDLRGFSRYVWTRDDPATAVRALTEAGEPTAGVLTAVAATDGLPVLVVAWTFDFFVLVGAVLAVVAGAALLVAIEARRRATAVAHALLVRMGLRAGAAYGSQVVELAAIAAGAVLAGLLGGVLVLAVAGHRLDPASWLTPVPVPVGLLPLGLLVTAVSAVAVLAAAAVAVRAAVRAPVRELLRG